MFEAVRDTLARAALTAMLTFGIEELPPWRYSAVRGVVAELLIDEVWADLVVLDVVYRR